MTQETISAPDVASSYAKTESERLVAASKANLRTAINDLGIALQRLENGESPEAARWMVKPNLAIQIEQDLALAFQHLRYAVILSGDSGK
jgi:hypothetical protein